jgi:hypothetical protein
MKELSTQYKAGHGGEDSMRSKAERMFHHEMQSMPKEIESASSTGRTKLRLYKKGGSVKAIHKLTKDQTDLHIPRRAKTPKLNIESLAEAQKMKKGGCYDQGGEVSMKKGGHKKKGYASGGTVYEREMVGEKPSSKMPHFNYEAEMKGSKCVSPSDHMSKGERVPGRGGNPMKEGGAMKHGGKAHKYAAGGAGKVRHGAASASGKPVVGRKKPMGNWP